MALHESGENYLETILLLKEKNGIVRSIDIANELSYSKASVSRAMSNLKKEELIIMEKNGSIIFTDKGYKEALNIYNRHKLLTKFLMETLDIDEDLASENACRIEHVVNDELVDKIKNKFGV